MSNPTNEANAYAETVSEENPGIRNLLYAAWMAGYNSRNQDFTRLRVALTEKENHCEYRLTKNNELQEEIKRLTEDSALLDALLNPAEHPIPKGWPYPDTRGRYDPPRIVCWRANSTDGMPERVPSPKTREELREAITRAKP